MKLYQRFTAHFITYMPNFRYKIRYYGNFLRINPKSHKCHWVNNTWVMYTNDSGLYDEIKHGELSVNRLKQIRKLIFIQGKRVYHP